MHVSCLCLCGSPRLYLRLSRFALILLRCLRQGHPESLTPICDGLSRLLGDKHETVAKKVPPLSLSHAHTHSTPPFLYLLRLPVQVIVAVNAVYKGTVDAFLTMAPAKAVRLAAQWTALTRLKRKVGPIVFSAFLSPLLLLVY